MMADPVLLVVHHTPSPAVDSLLQAVLDGTRADGIADVDVVVRPALSASVSDVLAADAFVLGTPANIGYMSGALKHFFDTVYYPALRAKVGAGYGVYIHGNNDTSGALRAVQGICTGLGWQERHAPVLTTGTPDKAARDACWDLGATLAASLMT